MRLVIVALLTSLAAGVFAAVTLRLMMVLIALIWDNRLAAAPVYAVVVCALGGVLIGLTRRTAHVQTLGEQIEAAADPLRQTRRRIAMTAMGAVLAVGFGGAIGPEAGLIAVITELAALVSLVVARSAAEARELGRVCVSAALASLYASPPGGYVYATGEEDGAPWAEARAQSIPFLGFVAALAGLAGFLLAARFLFTQSFHRIHLPPHVSPGDGSDILFALLPALFGAAVGAVFLHAHVRAARLVETRIVNPLLQSALGGLVLGCLAAALPTVRFSGHHEFDAMLQWGGGATAAALIGLALIKLLACAICLATGWRGGAIFPLVFAGGAAGLAAHHLQSGPDATVAVAAGLAGATAAGLGKPVAALLILVFLVGTETLLPICVGVAAGLAAARLSPRATH